MPNLSHTIIIDPDLRDYRITLTPGWAKRFERIAPVGNRLERIAFALLADLRNVSLTASMPYQMAGQLSSFATGFVNGKNEPNPTRRLADAITLKLGKRLRLDVPTMTAINGACLEIQHEVGVICATPHSIKPDAVWASYMEAKGFRFSVWGTQRISYVAAYNAFDNFLTRCVSIAVGQPSYRRRREDKFVATLEEHFGATVVDRCATGHAITAARLTRHALSHCGGRQTDDLRQLGHSIPVEDGLLQIRAQDVKAILRVIEDAAWTLAKSAVSLSQFGKKPKSAK